MPAEKIPARKSYVDQSPGPTEWLPPIQLNYGISPDTQARAEELRARVEQRNMDLWHQQQEMARQIAQTRRDHPIRYFRANMAYRAKLIFVRLLVFLVVALICVLVDLALIWLHSPIIIRPRF